MVCPTAHPLNHYATLSLQDSTPMLVKVMQLPASASFCGPQFPHVWEYPLGGVIVWRYMWTKCLAQCLTQSKPSVSDRAISKREPGPLALSPNSQQDGHSMGPPENCHVGHLHHCEVSCLFLKDAIWWLLNVLQSSSKLRFSPKYWFFKCIHPILALGNWRWQQQ